MAGKLAKYRAGAKHAVRHAAHRARGFLGPRIKPVAFAGGAGAIAQVVGQMARENVAFLRNNWYGEPGALLGVGLLAMKKNSTVGAALCGAAGYAGSFNYKLNQFQQGKGKTPVPSFQAAPAAGTTSGFDDADTGFHQTF